MSGVLGLDPQHTRTCLTLLDGLSRPRESAPVPQPVGDGRRRLIPNASGPGALWGSRSADHRLAGVRAASPTELTTHLLDWRRDPLDQAFLTGVRERLADYLGRPAGLGDYQLCIAIDPTIRSPVDDAAEAAGLVNVVRISPTDALLHRWLGRSGSAAAYEGDVVTVACGETETTATRYQVTVSQTHHAVTEIATRWNAVGALPISEALARLVPERCKQGIPPAVLLALLDGCLEFAAILRDLPERRAVSWDGPLADRLFAPLRIDRSELDRWPEVTALVGTLDDLLRPLCADSTPRELTVVVGGIGAAWPFVDRTAATFGTVWRSSDPEFDIATGAAWSRLSESPVVARRPLIREPNTPPGHIRTSPPDDLPVWLRDG